jgi:hypothetical protein
MRLNYIIDCHHCGGHYEYSTTTNYRTLVMAETNLLQHVDTECAMRCPACRSRLNATEADYRAQVRVVCQA